MALGYISSDVFALSLSHSPNTKRPRCLLTGAAVGDSLERATYQKKPL